MRITITLEADVAAGVRHLARERGLSVEEALRVVIRRGTDLNAPPPVRPAPVPLDLRVDVTNIGEVLELLDE